MAVTSEIKAVWSVMVVISAGFFTMHNLAMREVRQVVDKVNDRANFAVSKAESARPNPYTSIMAAKDWQTHFAMHTQGRSTVTQYFDSHLQLTQAKLESYMDTIQSQLLLSISSLEIPPPQVKRILSEYDKRLTDCEYRIGRSTAKRGSNE